MGTTRALGLIAALIALLASGGSALAHAAYKSSDPPDGGRVGSPPSQVSAEFTEPLADGSYLQITDPCGERVDGGDVRITGYTMSVSMDGSAAGRYVVFYRAHSQLDPHVTQGKFDFTAASGAPCPGSDDGRRSERGGGGGGSNGSSGGADSSDAGGSSAAPSDDVGAGSSAAGSNAAGSTERRPRSASGDGPRRLQQGDQGARVPNIAAGPEADRATKPVWDGIRLQPFLTSLLLAAIIGAAGGKIYAGIMGPRA